MSPLYTRKYRLKMSILSCRRWAGQTLLIRSIPSVFHYRVSSGSSGVVLLPNRRSDQTLPDHLPPSATLRTIFTRYLDINAVPRYGFFEILHHFAENPKEKERLQEFLDPEEAVRCRTFRTLFRPKSLTSSQEDLYEYAQMVRRTIKEVLEDFRSVHIPLDYIFDVFPPLRPREFSIASSVKVRHPV